MVCHLQSLISSREYTLVLRNLWLIFENVGTRGNQSVGIGGNWWESVGISGNQGIVGSGKGTCTLMYTHIVYTNFFIICGPVGKPAKEQPDRKVTGFQCTRSEVSGKRLWGLFKELCGNPENFFEHAYIHNYCPIAFMDKKGRNITPSEIKGAEIAKVHSACDKVLADIIRLLKVEILIGIGIYAEKRSQLVVQSHKLPIKILCLPHPSPRAANNKNWSEKATKKLSEFGLLECFTS
ncbi:single-strand-selective monofunctional uracil-DNA glycosylase isoform X3 [Lasioglossum baleicum]|uniref:single-strand-selective monofunctional uracil-DNA glycosylase isoform X3 n=1 Tax=Lasioglossum baleicum TaxID=434251 RepID=UPI003FCDEDC7